MRRAIHEIRRRQEKGNYLTAPLSLPGWESLSSLPSVELPEGRHLYLEGELVRQVFLIRRGVVKLKCTGQNAREMIVGIRSNGWIMGADAAILARAHDCTAVTMTPCEVSTFSRAEFLEELETPGALTRHLHVTLSYGMQSYLAAQVELRSESAQQRLEHLLTDLHALVHSVGTPRPELSQVEMAQMLAISPEHLCRIMGNKRKGRP